MRSVRRGSDLVLESSEAHNRTIYTLHQELEFAVPYEQIFTILPLFMKLYENLQPEGLPSAIFEVRFTPAGWSKNMIRKENLSMNLPAAYSSPNPRNCCSTAIVKQ